MQSHRHDLVYTQVAFTASGSNASGDSWCNGRAYTGSNYTSGVNGARTGSTTHGKQKGVKFIIKVL